MKNYTLGWVFSEHKCQKCKSWKWTDFIKFLLIQKNWHVKLDLKVMILPYLVLQRYIFYIQFQRKKIQSNVYEAEISFIYIFPLTVLQYSNKISKIRNQLLYFWNLCSEKPTLIFIKQKYVLLLTFFLCLCQNQCEAIQ